MTMDFNKYFLREEQHFALALATSKNYFRHFGYRSNKHCILFSFGKPLVKQYQPEVKFSRNLPPYSRRQR